jgi:1,4-dihydroxy-6-naphthoate synthase
MKLTLAYSPCPNDTFIFAALANRWIDCESIDFEITLADIDILNQMAANHTAQICKVSMFQYARLKNEYTLLSAGAALGRGAGPLLLTTAENQPLASQPNGLSTMRIAIPGRYTTANLLLDFYYTGFKEKKVLPFDQIMPAIVAGAVDAGVVIHESRFTYPQYGLVQIADLGAYWESQTGLPIPLGGIIAHNDLGTATHQQINHLIINSLDFAYQHPDIVAPYINAHAQEMKPAVQQQHIALYVNEFTRNLGTQGYEAIDKLISIIPQNS